MSVNREKVEMRNAHSTVVYYSSPRSVRTFMEKEKGRRTHAEGGIPPPHYTVLYSVLQLSVVYVLLWNRRKGEEHTEKDVVCVES